MAVGKQSVHVRDYDYDGRLEAREVRDRTSNLLWLRIEKPYVPLAHIQLKAQVNTFSVK
jgi:hypothetical protein